MSLSGNAGTVDGINFIVTIDNVPLSVRVNNQQAGRIDHYFAYVGLPFSKLKHLQILKEAADVWCSG